MAKLTMDKMRAALEPHLQEGEMLQHVAFGVKQPPIVVIFLLILLAILPGVIATFLLTKNYIVGLTDRRFLVLQVKGIGNAAVKEVREYDRGELGTKAVSTSTGSIFTHIKIEHSEKPFVAKFHRAFSKENRAEAMAIGEALAG